MTRKWIPCQLSSEKTLMMRASLILRDRLISRLTRRNFCSFFTSRGLRNLTATRAIERQVEGFENDAEAALADQLSRR